AHECFGTIVTTREEARQRAQSPECQRHPRDQVSGAPLNTWVTYDNLGWIKTRGFDIAFNWSLRLAELGMELPGTIGFNIQATYLDEFKTKASPKYFDIETDWKGSLGPTMASLNAGAYDYRLFGGLSYSQNNW